MNHIIGHIIGLDEIHKQNLIKTLPDYIKVIDLDKFQQEIYNDKKMVDQRAIWTKIGESISVKRNQRKLFNPKKNRSNRSKSSKNENPIDIAISKLVQKRNQIKQQIHEFWKESMTEKINSDLESVTESSPDSHVLFIGFNIYPKDYRQKVILPIEDFFTNKNGNGNKYFNKIMFGIKSNRYAENQIKYYLHRYPHKIINGTFPLNLLKPEYIASKYDKFTDYYYGHGYDFVAANELKHFILRLDKQLDTQLKLKDNLKDKFVYVATQYKTGPIIPFISKMPIEGFFNKENALLTIKSKMQRNGPVYLYQVPANQFNLIDGKLIANQALRPVESEEMLLT